ncbi:MAG: ribosomal L7Ae/L30e/S12e/Gadd45 family protein [Bacilli bacterium]|nr:ribosomal L7Ae/L30e/S12e/Gadd45 family protein [Bacilli bacterium]
MLNEKAWGFIGLLNKGGRLLIGSSLLASISKAKLIILAEDASETTKKTVLDKAASRHIEVLMTPSKGALGSCIGFDEISSIGVIDAKAAKVLKQKWGEGESK